MNTLQPTRTDLIEQTDSNDLVAPAQDSTLLVAALVAEAQRGCEDSYSQLAQRYFPRLVQLIRPRISGDHMDAEDIAQESLARAFQKLDTFNPQYRFSTWLYTIAFRIAIDHNRGRRRRLTLLETHRSLFEAKAKAESSSAAEYEKRDAADAIWQTARTVLGEQHYTAMWLRFAEDLSVEEIARVMRKTQVGVRVLLHRARVKMLQAMNTEDTIQSQKKSKLSE